jgi:hypothetical protein
VYYFELCSRNYSLPNGWALFDTGLRIKRLRWTPRPVFSNGPSAMREGFDFDSARCMRHRFCAICGLALFNATHYRAPHLRPIAWGCGEFKSRCLAHARARCMRALIKWTRKSSHAAPQTRATTKKLDEQEARRRLSPRERARDPRLRAGDHECGVGDRAQGGGGCSRIFPLGYFPVKRCGR